MSTSPPGRAVIAAYAGVAIPTFAAVLLIPHLVRNLGSERFGLLSLILGITAFFGAFDFGVGVALSRYLARLRARTDIRSRQCRLFFNALVLQVAIGVIVASLLLAGYYASRAAIVRGSEAIFAAELDGAAWYLAASLPISLAAGAARAALEGAGHFQLANALRALSSVTMFGAPVACSFVTQRLDVIVFSILASRVLVCSLFLHAWRGSTACEFGGVSNLRCLRAHSRVLLSYGRWLMIGIAFGGLITLGLLDRVMINTLLGPGSMLAYAVPSDIVVRLLLLPAAICSVLIPTLSRAVARRKCEFSSTYAEGLDLVARQVGPLCLVLVLNAEGIIDLLLPANPDPRAATIMAWLAVGIFLHSLAHVPYAALHALGRPDYAAYRHVFQLPFYALASWILVQAGNVAGLGALWAGWALLDLAMIVAFLGRAAPEIRPWRTSARLAVVSWLVPLGIALAYGVTLGSTSRLALSLAAAALFAYEVWRLAAASTRRPHDLR